MQGKESVFSGKNSNKRVFSDSNGINKMGKTMFVSVLEICAKQR